MDGVLSEPSTRGWGGLGGCQDPTQGWGGQGEKGRGGGGAEVKPEFCGVCYPVMKFSFQVGK